MDAVETEVNPRAIAGLKNKILQAFKETGGIKGELTHSYDEELGIHTIILENNLGNFSAAMAEVVAKSDKAEVCTSGDRTGYFDWEKDAYIKDYAWVEFTI